MRLAQQLTALILLLAWLSACAMKTPTPAPIPKAQTGPAYVFVPAGVPGSTRICVALEQQMRWDCRTVDELRQILSSLRKS